MEQTRRDYILKHLATPYHGGYWIRISAPELFQFGGPEFFKPLCQVMYVDEKVFTTVPGTKGWTMREKTTLPWKIIPPSAGWKPQSQLWDEYHNGITNEGKPQMEHHIDRSKLIEVVTANKEAYTLVRDRAMELYRAEIEKKTEEHVQGQIAVNGIQVVDKTGQITIPNDMSETFDQQLRALDLDSREVIVLDDGEYLVYVESQATNLANLGAVTKRLEEL